jgi:putative colanic acid biosynthesis UDP-glucose lipid carrier transferase
MANRFFYSLQLGLAVLDFLIINTVFFTAEFLFRKHLLISYDIEYVYFILFLNVVWLIVALAKSIYNEQYIASFEKFSKVSMQAYMWLLTIMVICLFFFRWMMLSRIFVVTVLGGICVALVSNRLIYLVVYHYFKRTSGLISKVVIIGYNNLSKKLVDYLAADSLNKEVIGFCEEYENIHELSAYPILSNVSGAMEVCKKYRVTEIYSTIAPEQNQHLYELIQSADDNCIRFKIVPDLGFFFKRQMHIDYLKEIPVISLRKEPLEELSNRIKKRIFDIIVSLFVVVAILSWLIPLIGLLIRLESKGPVFFAQKRTGKNNRSFWCLKFRSMRQNKNSDTQQASRNDGRVTRIGRFLRRTSLDEFPQFINVLHGDMSVVGPRPHMLKHTDEYSKLIAKYMVRQFLKPGITGWAQVNGYRGETQVVLQMQRRVEHDLWYMENWSLYFDIKIVVMTVFNTVKGEKNAF